MRILYVCNDFGIPPDGSKGPSIHLRAITAALHEAGHEVLLLSPRQGPGPGHPAVRLLPPGCPWVDGPLAMLRDALRRQELDDTVAAEMRPLMYAAWVRGAALEALRGVRVDVVLERLSLLSTLGLELAGELGVPLALEVNALMSEEARCFRRLNMGDLAEQVELRVLRAADAVLPVSQALADRIAAAGVAPERMQVVPNGVDLAAFEQAGPRSETRRNLGLGGGLVIGFVGSLKVWHGVEILVDAFAHVHHERSEARLLIVGHGPTEADLRARVARLGLTQAVVFTGSVPHERVPELIRAMDIAAAPFLPQDGFYFSPIKLFEYMAGRACIVAARLGQIADVISDGENGLLFDAGDVAEMAATLRRAFDPVLRARLAARAVEDVRRRHTWSHAAEKTAGVLRSLCGDAPDACPAERVAS